ncbi:hypothetical protein BDP27DRAFT_326303 [Rhodocollybia butyracea]|uniref:Uncharacterized protein n=1 Tax=Rhodocollybia butyracea TaxID=206335 RepID=A0A9P5TZK3_9AGAR|nr:hypothetical protein BDP27DRAFT_326303 [Rhodocollybia butyracea]
MGQRACPSPLGRVFQIFHLPSPGQLAAREERCVQKRVSLFTLRPARFPVCLSGSMPAMRVRRGDYKDACIDLANWNSMLEPAMSFLTILERPQEEAVAGTPRKPWRGMLPTLDTVVQKVTRDSKEDYININVGPGVGLRIGHSMCSTFSLMRRESGWTS